MLLRGSTNSGKAFLALASATACSLTIFGCAAADSYAGILLAPARGDPQIQSLAMRAKQGDKHAQLELGIRYEEGQGLPVDHIRAARLYTSAATSSGGVRWIYVPPVGPKKQGQTMAVSGGPAIPGLVAAKQRLRDLQKRLGR